MPKRPRSQYVPGATADKCVNTNRSYLRANKKIQSFATHDAATQTCPADKTERERSDVYIFSPEKEKKKNKQEAIIEKPMPQGVTRIASLYDFEEDLNNVKKRGLHEHKYGYVIPPIRTTSMLLVFREQDTALETLSRAGDKLGFETVVCANNEGALEEFQNRHFDLIVVDTRQAKSTEYEALCRAIRNTKSGHYSVLIALVKRSVLERDDSNLMAILEAGFNRCLVETSNNSLCLNELLQIRHSELRDVANQSICQTLYAALDRCKDMILVSEETFKLQYTNRSFNKIIGYRAEEILGRNLDNLSADISQMNAMTSTLLSRREWQGQLLLKRKPTDNLVLNCRAVPVSCIGRIPTHYVFIMESPLDDAGGRGSVHSLRRGSTDVKSVGSDYLRRTSLAKLHTLPLEAPITKILTQIAQAQEWSQANPQVIQILDKVIDQLHSTELYAISVKGNQAVKADEAVASDLISGLLAQQPAPAVTTLSRRSSNDSGLLRTRIPQGPKIKVPPHLKDILNCHLSWEFDIFRLEDICQRKPLQHLGMSLFLHFDVPNTLNCDESTLYNWLTVIELNYHLDNTYHNSTHAADVMQATAGFLEKERMKSLMEPLDDATSLIAAAAHDVDHPGKSSAFLSNSSNMLAILYNDVTVLEMHHASLTFKLTLGDDRVNIFKNLDKEMYKIARHNVIDMILATEMTKHFEHLAKFVNVFCEKPTDDEGEFIPISIPENVTLVKRMMIKCADVSNPTRPLRQCVEWARRITEEYFKQTDEEKSKGLPVVMPMFDRATCSIPKAQIGFVDYIITDMFEAWNAFIDMPELIAYMRQNYLKWKELDEQGHTTLADIRKIQTTAALAPVFPGKDQKTSS